MSRSFRPMAAPAVISATTSSSAATAIGYDASMGALYQVRVTNTMTSGYLSIKFGASDVGVSVIDTDIIMGFGATEVFTFTPDKTHVRVILSTGTAKVQLTAGEGL